MDASAATTVYSAHSYPCELVVHHSPTSSVQHSVSDRSGSARPSVASMRMSVAQTAMFRAGDVSHPHRVGRVTSPQRMPRKDSMELRARLSTCTSGYRTEPSHRTVGRLGYCRRSYGEEYTTIPKHIKFLKFP